MQYFYQSFIIFEPTSLNVSQSLHTFQRLINPGQNYFRYGTCVQTHRDLYTPVGRYKLPPPPTQVPSLIAATRSIIRRDYSRSRAIINIRASRFTRRADNNRSGGGGRGGGGGSPTRGPPGAVMEDTPSASLGRVPLLNIAFK